MGNPGSEKKKDESRSTWLTFFGLRFQNLYDICINKIRQRLY